MFSIFNRKPFHPDFIKWRFGNLDYKSAVSAKSDEFNFLFLPSIERKHYDFKTEIQNACEQINKNRNKKSISVCYSGGVYSQLLHKSLKKMGIDHSLHFLDIWGLNSKEFKEKVANTTDQEVNIIRLKKDFFYEHYVLDVFQKFGCDLPTPLALTYLAKYLGKDSFVVMANGGLNREGKLFEKISSDLKLQKPFQTILPFSYSSVFYYLWSQQNKISGEFYFFSSTPSLLAASIPYLQNPRNFLFEFFPELKPCKISTNWDGDSQKENKWVRQWLWKNVANNPKFPLKEKAIGAAADLNQIFLN